MRAIHTFTVAAELPDELSSLRELAMNVGWSVHHRVREVFSRVGPVNGAAGFEPLRLLAEAPRPVLVSLARDAEYVARVDGLLARLQREDREARWYQLHRDGEIRSVAYFSPEFGIAEALPQYSGGLGVLAGDHLKAAADMGLPLVGIGLFYRHGYFRQGLDRDGWQRERYPRLEPRELPLEPVPDVGVTVELAGIPVQVQVWRAQVGRVPLYLLDTDVEGNDTEGAEITDRLYGGHKEQRIRQEIVLGVGGVRVLRALGIDTQVFHMNEGHAGFLALERIRELVVDHHLPFHEAIEVARTGTVFTTHTPVPAGIDRFPRDLVERYFGGWAAQVGVPVDVLLGIGHEPGTPRGEELNQAVLGLRLSERANGVAQLHGAVSRRMFAGVWPDVPVDEVPIGAVTNGIHVPSWTSREMADLYERHIGSDWSTAEAERWNDLDSVTPAELWAARTAARRQLVTSARARVRRSRAARGETASQLDWIDDLLDPGVLTVGFARRFATYKRADLILRDPDRLRRLVLDPDRPVQLLFAGKAHPADDDGKEMLRAVATVADDLELRRRVVVLEDYDIAVGRTLYHGVDVWLNNPRRPLEACGTSGMKVVLNGALNLSVLDGWWDEMYEPGVGWAIPSAVDVDDAGHRDDLEAQALLALLTADVVPAFYDRGADGVPAAWVDRMRTSIVRLGPKVTAQRMLRDYVEGSYEPAARRVDALAVDGWAPARDLARWRSRVADAWSAVAVRAVHCTEADGRLETVEADVDLGSLAPSDVSVEVLCGAVDADSELIDADATTMKPADGGGSQLRYRAALSIAQTGTFGVAVRVTPSHPHLVSWTDLARVTWAQPEALST